MRCAAGEVAVFPHLGVAPLGLADVADAIDAASAHPRPYVLWNLCTGEVSRHTTFRAFS